MSDPLKLFHFLFVDNGAKQTLVLLHGTGADEHDLLPLVANLRGRYNFLSLRGNVSEHGMLRFFRRYPDGTFDEANIGEEVAKMSTFLRAWCAQNTVESASLAYLGYSNGANMILALACTFPEIVARAVLLHSKFPVSPSSINLSGKKFLISYGETDRMIPAEQTSETIETLERYGAEVQIVSHEGGHEIRQVEKVAFEAFL